jgi:hypothetical protein
MCKKPKKPLLPRAKVLNRKNANKKVQGRREGKGPVLLWANGVTQ